MMRRDLALFIMDLREAECKRWLRRVLLARGGEWPTHGLSVEQRAELKAMLHEMAGLPMPQPE